MLWSSDLRTSGLPTSYLCGTRVWAGSPAVGTHEPFRKPSRSAHPTPSYPLWPLREQPEKAPPPHAPESALGPAGQVGGAGSSQFAKRRLTLTSGAGRRQDVGSWGPAARTQRSWGAALAREPALLCVFRFRLSAPGQPRRVTDASSFAARGRGGNCQATAEGSGLPVLCCKFTWIWGFVVP